MNGMPILRSMIDEPDALTTQEVADLLRGVAAAVHNEVRQLPEAVLRWHPASDEWCIKEILGHLIEAEQRGFAGRIRAILSVDGPRLEAWDQGAVERERYDCDRTASALLNEFEGLRDGSVEMVRGLRSVDLSCGGHHPRVGFLRVQDLLSEWIHHDRNHLRQMLANVQSYVWPHMGNAQRF
jgi:DinB family protein